MYGAEEDSDRLYYCQLAGSRGHVYLHGPKQLGAYLERSSQNAWGQRLLAVKSAKLVQHGDHEIACTFHKDDIRDVARALGLRNWKYVDP